jgi:hypothetical protein
VDRLIDELAVVPDRLAGGQLSHGLVALAAPTDVARQLGATRTARSRRGHPRGIGRAHRLVELPLRCGAFAERGHATNYDWPYASGRIRRPGTERSHQVANLMDEIVSLAKRRGIAFKSSEIYGGLRSSWDYGPIGVELKNNVKQAWWRSMVQRRDDVVGLDAAVIMSPKVWEASGHLEVFHDPLVECLSCHQRFRRDHLPEPPVCPNCGGKGFTDPRNFNLMFSTHMGPVPDEDNKVYLRPETAQAPFVDFAQIQTASRKKIPFGIAQIG